MAKKKEVKPTRYHCNRCGHEWNLRDTGYSPICPKCKLPPLPPWKGRMIVVQPAGY